AAILLKSPNADGLRTTPSHTVRALGPEITMTDTVHRLLVIEDNDADVFLIKRALQENNIPAEVTVCSDGEAAVRTLNSIEMEHPPDAIIIDLALPLIEGLDVLRKILHRPA